MQMRPPKNSWSSTSARTLSCWSALYLGLTAFVHSSLLSNHHLFPQPNYPPSLSILGRYLHLLRSQMTEVRASTQLTASTPTDFIKSVFLHSSFPSTLEDAVSALQPTVHWRWIPLSVLSISSPSLFDRTPLYVSTTHSYLQFLFFFLAFILSIWIC